MPSTVKPPDQPHPDLLLSLRTLRAKLEEQRQFRTEQIAALTSPVAPLAVPAMRVDTARDQVSATLLSGARQALADIDAALYRMLVGRYGDCQNCGTGIELQRLYAIPQSALCAECHRAAGREEAGRDG
jgi:RNA polymerase-binding transcription factor DksA